METIINIPVEELNKVCAKKDKRFSTKTHFNLQNRENVHEIFKYQKFLDDFSNTITCSNNGKDFIGTFKPNYDEFLQSIIKTLNLKLPRGYSDDEELTTKLLERLTFLKSLPDEAWLYNEFPMLYRTLQGGRRYAKEIEELKKDSSYSDLGKEEEHYYYSCGLRKDLYNFITTQIKVYERFIKNRKEYKKLINKKSYNKFIENNYDMDKLAMYLAHKYLAKCENTADKKIVLNRYKKIIEKYINSTYDKNTSITIDNTYIDFNNIKERYSQLEKRIDKIDAEVEWVLIPEGKRDKYVKAGLDPIKHYMSAEEFENLKKAGEEKTKFYKDNAPLLKAYGRLKYSGYIAYIYPNGEVLLDTEYDERFPASAKGNAIYYMKANWFDIVSRLDKTALKSHPQVNRFYHAGNWQKRAQELIDKEGTEEDKEKAKELVKRIMKENEKNIK